MAGFTCPKHGNQFALWFCDHAGTAVDNRQQVAVYLQCFEGGWFTLCDACARRTEQPDTFYDAGYLVCVKCAIEWAEVTGNRYVERSQTPVPEFPPDPDQM